MKLFLRLPKARCKPCNLLNKCNNAVPGQNQLRDAKLQKKGVRKKIETLQGLLKKKGGLVQFLTDFD